VKTETTDDPNNMANIGLWFLKMLQQQGLSFVLLGVAIWYLLGKMNYLETKYDTCQQMTIELYKSYYNEDKEVLIKVLDKLEELPQQPSSYGKKR